MKTVILIIGSIGLGVGICVSGIRIYGELQNWYDAREKMICWDRLGQSLEGKKFELDLKAQKIKSFELLTHEDLLRALYVLQIKLDQKDFSLNAIKGFIRDSDNPDIGR